MTEMTRFPFDDELTDDVDHELRTALLVDQLGFTPEEAAAFVQGDQRALNTVAIRRIRTAESLTLVGDEGDEAAQR